MQQLTEADYDTPEQQIGHFQTNRAWESCVTMTKCRNDTGGWSYRPGEPTDPMRNALRCWSARSPATATCCSTLVRCPLEKSCPSRLRFSRRWEAGSKSTGRVSTARAAGLSPTGRWGGSTRRDNKIWLHVLHWSSGMTTLRLPPLQDAIQSALTLDGAKPKTSQTGSGLEITLPKAQQEPLDTVIELTL